MKKIKYFIFVLLLSVLSCITSQNTSIALSFDTSKKSIDTNTPSSGVIKTDPQYRSKGNIGIDPGFLMPGIDNIDPKMLIPGNPEIDPEFLVDKLNIK
jgi:hypothetical protein